MQVVNRGRRYELRIALCVLVVALLAGCGSSKDSENPNTLLKQTFSGSHKITSGNLDFKLTITPTGSSTFRQPIVVEFGGPFQSRGKGKLPQSNFSIRVSAQGQNTSLGILSTGTNGYVSLDGQNYQLPKATFQKLESNFSSVASTSDNGSSSSALTKFGIQPLNWLRSPTVVGSEDVGGETTTHIRAGVNVPSLVDGISVFLQKASKLGVSGTTGFPSGLSASAKNQIATEIQRPSFDLWTGNDDKTMRRLQLGLTIPVTGKVSTAFGGVTSATLGLKVQYSNLNQPQTISAPSSVQPFSQFQAKLQSIVQALGGVSGAASGSTGSAGATGATGSSGASAPTGSAGVTGATGSAGTATTGTTPSAETAYSQCIQNAGGDVGKMQQCGSLLNGQ